MNLISDIDRSKVVFGTNLGVATATCDHRDVSGTRRFKYFTSAISIHPGQYGEYDDSENLDPFVEQQEKSAPIYIDNGTQTETPVPRKLSLDEERHMFMDEIPELVCIRQERGQLEVERRKQMAKIPSKTEEKAWAASLEENRRKDFALREKELDLVIQHKMMLVKKDLYKKDAHEENENKERVKTFEHSKIPLPKEVQHNDDSCGILQSKKDKTITMSEKVTNELELRNSNRDAVQTQQDEIHELKIKSTWKTCIKRSLGNKFERYDAYRAREEKDHSNDLALISSIFEKKYGQ